MFEYLLAELLPPKAVSNLKSIFQKKCQNFIFHVLFFNKQSLMKRSEKLLVCYIDPFLITEIYFSKDSKKTYKSRL